MRMPTRRNNNIGAAGWVAPHLKLLISRELARKLRGQIEWTFISSRIHQFGRNHVTEVSVTLVQA